MVKIVLGKQSQQALAQPMPFGDDSSSMNRRVKILEERFTNMRNRTQVVEQNMLAKHRNFFTEIKTLSLEMIEIKKEINEIKDRVVMLAKEMEVFARREEVEILRKYIDLWNPVKFVSKNEIETIVREVIDKMRRE